MEVRSVENIAGMSLGGGKKENFFFSLLEYYPEKKRWFLTSLHQVREEDHKDRDEIIKNWVKNYGLKKLVVNFPLSSPPCEKSCLSHCEGALLCPRPTVKAVRDEMNRILQEDRDFFLSHPKKYEHQRLASNEIHHGKNLLKKNTDEHMLSKSFKRKLRKGFTPYWHRPIDFWVWKNYYDQLLDVFKISYESFGNVSLMLLARLNYLMRHLPQDLVMYESHIQLCLLELYRAKLINKSTLFELKDLDLATFAREKILHQIEKNGEIFIYHHDFDTMIKNHQAFESFLLSVVGQRMLLKRLRKIPEWGTSDGSNFIVPSFDVRDSF